MHCLVEANFSRFQDTPIFNDSFRHDHTILNNAVIAYGDIIVDNRVGDFASLANFDCPPNIALEDLSRLRECEIRRNHAIYHQNLPL
mmetsp:Transcript_12558/g.12359  ORF Transcript_12558/g.12359 Transcript_12558/m.12359 type:complete len:87 (-) Transcript_12558:1158-1418(-)